MPVYGQKSGSEPTQIQEFTRPSRTIKTTRDEEFRGSRYFNEDWETGYVIFTSGQKSKTVDLKYSTFNNEILFQKGDALLAVIPRTFSGFVLTADEKDLIFKKGYNSDKYNISNGQILQVIYDGNVKLLIHHQNRLQRGNRPDPLTGKITHRFRTDEYNYLVDARSIWHKIDLDRDDVLNALGKKKDALKSFAESNDLNFDEPEDLNKILAKYDEISAGQKK